MDTKRCEHVREGAGLNHAHVVYLNGIEHILCDACYAKLYQRLIADQMPKTWFDNPLTEPDSSHTEPLAEPASKPWRRIT